MRKYYDKVSLKSRLLNILFKFTDAKKNYLTEENTKKFIEKYKTLKESYNEFEKLGFEKEVISKLEVYTYNGTLSKNTGKVLLYIHGGSFLEEAISYQLEFAMKIASNTNSTLIVPRYSLIPEGNYKKMYDFIDEVYEKIIKSTDVINFVGDSSGGGFILAYAMYLRDKKSILPKNLLMLSPWVDLSMDNPELLESIKYDNMSGLEGNRYCGKLWADGENVKDAKISPLFGTFENLPKITIATGSFDILKPDCIKLANKLEDSNVEYNYIEYKRQGHDFGCYPTKEGELLIEDFSNIINDK